MPQDELSASTPARRGAPEIYPWHAEVWAQMTRRLDQLPHALLLYGQPGLGKLAFALRLARRLLCAQADAAHEACGACQSCRLFAAGNHPDFSLVEPQEDSVVIKIEQVQALRGFLALRPHTAARKVVVLAPAEAMNAHAANSLLKQLEEPPLGSTMMLVTSMPARLPLTVRSRCTRFLFRAPPRPEALGWLEGRAQDAVSLLDAAGGAPLRAIELERSGFAAQHAKLLGDVEALSAGRESPVACAARWKSMGAENCLNWLHGLIADLAKAALAPAAALANPEAGARLQPLLKGLHSKALLRFLDLVAESRRMLGTPLDEQLLLEDLLIRWCRLTKKLH